MSLKVEYALEIDATPDAIWSVFEHIEQWPRWDSDALKSVRWVSGEPWTQGARFEMQLAKPMPFTLTPEILEIVAPVYVHLKGQGSGVTGEQHYIFKWNPETRVTEARTLQEFSGMPITFMGNKLREPILNGIAHMFSRIKQEAEAQILETVPTATEAAEPVPASPQGPNDNLPTPEARPHELPEREIAPRDLPPDVPGPSVQNGGTEVTQAPAKPSEQPTPAETEVPPDTPPSQGQNS